MVYFKVPALDSTLMEGHGQTSRKKKKKKEKNVLVANTWKCLQVP